MVAFGIALLLVALLSAFAGAVRARAACQRRWALHLNQYTLRDALTGLQNQSALLETLAQTLSLADRLRHPVTVLMLEIDSYKQLAAQETPENMVHVVHTLAQRMRQRVRTHDVLGRWDEAHFFAILPDTDVASALVLVEDLRELCATQAIDVEGRTMTVTLSTGVYGRSPTEAKPLHDMAAEMVVAAQRALEATAADGPGRIEIEP